MLVEKVLLQWDFFSSAVVCSNHALPLPTQESVLVIVQPPPAYVVEQLNLNQIPDYPYLSPPCESRFEK